MNEFGYLDPMNNSFLYGGYIPQGYRRRQEVEELIAQYPWMAFSNATKPPVDELAIMGIDDPLIRNYIEARNALANGTSNPIKKTENDKAEQETVAEEEDEPVTTKNDGKFSFLQGFKYAGEDLIAPFKEMFSSKENLIKGGALMAGTIALGIACPWIGFGLAAMGVGTGALIAGKGIYNLFTAKDGDEQEHAFGNAVSGTFVAATSAFATKAAWGYAKNNKLINIPKFKGPKALKGAQPTKVEKEIAKHNSEKSVKKMLSGIKGTGTKAVEKNNRIIANLETQIEGNNNKINDINRELQAPDIKQGRINKLNETKAKLTRDNTISQEVITDLRSKEDALLLKNHPFSGGMEEEGLLYELETKAALCTDKIEDINTKLKVSGLSRGEKIKLLKDREKLRIERGKLQKDAAYLSEFCKTKKGADLIKKISGKDPEDTIIARQKAINEKTKQLIETETNALQNADPNIAAEMYKTTVDRYISNITDYDIAIYQSQGKLESMRGSHNIFAISKSKANLAELLKNPEANAEAIAKERIILANLQRNPQANASAIINEEKHLNMLIDEKEVQRNTLHHILTNKDNNAPTPPASPGDDIIPPDHPIRTAPSVTGSSEPPVIPNIPPHPGKIETISVKPEDINFENLSDIDYRDITYMSKFISKDRNKSTVGDRQQIEFREPSLTDETQKPVMLGTEVKGNELPNFAHVKGNEGPALGAEKRALESWTKEQKDLFAEYQNMDVNDPNREVLYTRLCKLGTNVEKAENNYNTSFNFVQNHVDPLPENMQNLVDAQNTGRLPINSNQKAVDTGIFGDEPRLTPQKVAEFDAEVEQTPAGLEKLTQQLNEIDELLQGDNLSKLSSDEVGKAITLFNKKAAEKQDLELKLVIQQGSNEANKTPAPDGKDVGNKIDEVFDLDGGNSGNKAENPFEQSHSENVTPKVQKYSSTEEIDTRINHITDVEMEKVLREGGWPQDANGELLSLSPERWQKMDPKTKNKYQKLFDEACELESNKGKSITNASPTHDGQDINMTDNHINDRKNELVKPNASSTESGDGVTNNNSGKIESQPEIENPVKKTPQARVLTEADRQSWIDEEIILKKNRIADYNNPDKPEDFNNTNKDIYIKGNQKDIEFLTKIKNSDIKSPEVQDWIKKEMKYASEMVADYKKSEMPSIESLYQKEYDILASYLLP